MYITPREIEEDSKITENNKTYKYTHGYSLIVNTVNDQNDDGFSEYILSDYSKSDVLNIKEPRIYFGLQTQSNIVVNVDDAKEYDHPITATTFNENVYDGPAGKNYNFMDRLIIALRDKNMKIINYEIKLLIVRNGSREVDRLAGLNDSVSLGSGVVKAVYHTCLRLDADKSALAATNLQMYRMVVAEDGGIVQIFRRLVGVKADGVHPQVGVETAHVRQTVLQMLFLSHSHRIPLLLQILLEICKNI